MLVTLLEGTLRYEDLLASVDIDDRSGPARRRSVVTMRTHSNFKLGLVHTIAACSCQQHEDLVIFEMLERIDVLDYLGVETRQTGRRRRAFGYTAEGSAALETAARPLEAVAVLDGAVLQHLMFIRLHIRQCREQSPMSSRRLVWDS